MKKSVLIIFTLVSTLIILHSCKKKKLNKNLFEEATASDLVFYQNNDSILSPGGPSPHGPFKLRFNSTTASQLGPDGRFPTGNTFASGSLIVKELYSGNTLTLIAVMKKDDSKFAANGWLWAEYEPDGKIKYNINEKGKSCIGCHSEPLNRDYTKSFDLH